MLELTKKRVKNWLKRHSLSVTVSSLLLALAFVFFWPKMIITIGPGQEGVLWTRWTGTQLDVVYREGTQFIFPWNVMYIYDLRFRKSDFRAAVLSVDGLEINVDVTARYSLQDKIVPQLHKKIGPDYEQKVVIPEIVAAVRETMGQYRPEELYTAQTQTMQEQVLAAAAVKLRDHFVVLDDVLLRRIELPGTIQQAIQRKLDQEQQSLEYAFRVQKERQEATRKEIEADGIRRFQKTVQMNLSDQYLRWKGIEATLELAKSNNSKVIVIGSSPSGLPLIFNPPQ
jgi:regulator of protease activity HflC (stomatin/prohibitin superfamily)